MGTNYRDNCMAERINMGITLFTNNAFSSVSDPDEYSPVLIQHLSAGLKYLLIQGLVKTLCRGRRTHCSWHPDVYHRLALCSVLK